MKSRFSLLILLFTIFVFCEDCFSQGPPPWAPAHGYRAKTRYVYFPDQNMYYDLNARNYIYLSGTNWVVRATLPKLFIGINLGNSAQIELDFVGDRPYRYNATHVVKYKKRKVKKIHQENVIIVNPGNYGHKHGHSHGKGHGKH